ncbi:hypothetical protein HDU98_001566 [Podochytrium sp. JEL0797]|nr:hypothetical protein HDU98_001566 [Podochytrium sp. JEL0797]
MATTTSPVNYYANMFVFVVYNVCVAMGVVACSLPMLPFRAFNLARPVYRAWIRQVQAAYISALLILTAVMLPGSKFVLTGDHDKMKPDVKQVIISNHQIYPDWFYLFCFALLKKCHADVKVILIAVLAKLPIFGQGMWFFEFIFMKQRFEKDKHNLSHNLTLAKNDSTNPLWLLIFPEGTLNTPGNIEKSKAFAKKMNINSHPNHCILPKSTGLFFSLQTLSPCVTDLFDLTVAYSGLDGIEIPYDRYLIDRVFFAKEYPREIHIHATRYEAKQLPGFSETDVATYSEEVRKSRFEEWLRGVWFEKDERMARFYKQGKMVEVGSGNSVAKTTEKELKPSLGDWFALVWLLGGGFLLTRVYVKAVWWALAALVAIVWG